MIKRSPSWTKEEVLLVLEIGHRLGWPKTLNEDNPLVAEVSRALNEANIHPKNVQSNKHRNIAGVLRKYADLSTLMPWHDGKPTKGGNLTAEITSLYLANIPEALKQTKEAREQISSHFS